MNSVSMRIAFRTDGSTTIGIGHVMRCMALADAMEDAGAQVHFACRKLDTDISHRLRIRGFNVSSLPAPAGEVMTTDTTEPAHAIWAGVPWELDAQQTIDALREWQPEWVVVDHYAFDARWHQMVKNELGTRIAVIDELADRNLLADLIIDQTPHPDYREKYRHHLQGSSAVILGGPRFALLGRSYSNAAHYQPSADIRSIGIFMGGSDPGNFSSLAWHACREVAKFQGPIEIVTTKANPHRAELELLAQRDSNTSLSVDLPDLASFFVRHDLQIGAGGGSTWERCCVGAPTLTLVIADNQKSLIPQLAQLGAVATLPENTVINEQSIGQTVLQMTRDPSVRLALCQRSSQLVDGIGATRVALCMMSSYLTVRPATIDDAECMYVWRNAQEIRAVSTHQELIDRPSHLQWLGNALVDSSRTILVGTVGSRPVGVIRFDRMNTGIHEVSLYLDPLLHGLKLGTWLLKAGEQAIQKINQKSALTFSASILADNIASQRLFKESGYIFTGTHWFKSSDSQ